MAENTTNGLIPAIEFYKWAIAQKGHGVNTPLPRQLKQIIRLFFRKEGIDAIAQVEREVLNAKGVTPALVQRKQEAPKKGSSDQRLERIALRESGQVEGAQTKARIKRMQRLAHKGVLGTPTLETVSEESENVAEVKAARKPREPKAEKVEMAESVQPLNTTEIQKIGTMGSKEIVDAFGADRILATLEAFKDPDLSLSGSPKQLANRLKFRIYPQV